MPRARGWPTVLVAEIDPSDADTAAFCDRYDVGLGRVGVNCVVVAGSTGRRHERCWAACMVLATDRADVNGVVRRRLDARKASFAPMDVAVAETGHGVRRHHRDRAAGGLADPGRRAG